MRHLVKHFCFVFVFPICRILATDLPPFVKAAYNGLEASKRQQTHADMCRHKDAMQFVEAATGFKELSQGIGPLAEIVLQFNLATDAWTDRND